MWLLPSRIVLTLVFLNIITLGKCIAHKDNEDSNENISKSIQKQQSETTKCSNESTSEESGKKKCMSDSEESESENNDLEGRLIKALLHYGESGEVSEDLGKDLELIANYTLNFRDMTVKSITHGSVCLVCRVITGILLSYAKIGGQKSSAASALKKICTMFEPEKVCDGIIDLNIDIFVYIFKNKKDLSSSKICSIIGQQYNCNDDNDDSSWNIYIPPPPVNISKEATNLQNTKPIQILHITDMHYDYKYTAGGNTKCGDPLCCGVDQGIPKNPEDAAGLWGDYRDCDMPYYAIENMMDTASQFNPDFIYHTGDIINHRVWETTRELNTVNILKILELFRNKFPNKTIYHTVGNHESNPLNEFGPEQITENNLSTHWLYNMLAEEWSTWLPHRTQITVRKGGYYTALIRPGLRIISINSNVCYIFNWWLIYSDEDPYGQLQWLSDILYQAEMDNEAVHILSHVPSGEKQCYKKWSQEYNKIIRRFSNTIKAQFVGHTHFDEMNLYYDKDKEDPINVAFNGGSFTTYEGVNPNFRIYTVNSNTYQIEDYDMWIYNVTEANLHGSPKWYKLYSFKELYGVPSMDLPELGKFAYSLATEANISTAYSIMKYRASDFFFNKGCDDKCREESLCNLVTSEYGNDDKCIQMKNEYRNAKTSKKL